MATRNNVDGETGPGSSLSTLRISVADLVALNVRAQRIKNNPLPEFLYQSLPAKGMTLLASLPHGPAVVSIPGESSLGRGYPFQREPASSVDGLLITYSRKTNGRYEADTVKYQSREYAIGDFVGFACRWVQQHVGNVKEIPGRYICVAPSREAWGVVLRDNGFTAWDPSRIASGLCADLQAKMRTPESSAVAVRVPYFFGDKLSSDDGLPMFARVEVTRDPAPGLHSAWIGFDEYLQGRGIRERLPDRIISDFQEWLNKLTEESGFSHWTFTPGMLFGDCIEWWGDRCRRRTKHEGIDFARGFLSGSGIRSIPEDVPVRSIADGEVAAILDDFLGKTVVIRHSSIARPDGDVFHTLLSHIRPLVARNELVSKGRIIGCVGKLTQARVPAHLHLAGAWFSKDLPPDTLTIDHIHPAYDPVALTDFHELMQGDHSCRLDLPEAPSQ
jgi:hypothetical protein